MVALYSLIGKDKKTAFQEFIDFFTFFEQVKCFGLPASNWDLE